MNSDTRPDELHTMARRVIDGNHYMTPGTNGRDPRPRLSPGVLHLCAPLGLLLGLLAPRSAFAQSRTAPVLEIVIFDCTAPVGEGEAE
jgi:hypothetical protein